MASQDRGRIARSPVTVATHDVARRPTGRKLLLHRGALPRQPLALARRNRLKLTNVIVPNQRLALPKGARLTAPAAAGPPASRDAVRSAIDYWSRVYGVDPALARALAWMESGFQQDVVSNVGAIGVMQLLPETWEFVDVVLLGVSTPRTYQGTSGQVFAISGGSSTSSAATVGSRSRGGTRVRGRFARRGLFDDTKEFVRIVLTLYGSV